MNSSNFYVVDSCGTCAHSEVCAHRIKGNNTAATGIASEAARELPEPFKIQLFCSKYKNRILN